MADSILADQCTPDAGSQAAEFGILDSYPAPEILAN
jgi:hypothetical protein